MKKILLVDDEQRMLDLLSIYLSPFYCCIKVSSGQEALEYLENHQVDLVLLDIMMPRMDGWETCREIRRFYEIPIIMLTARNEKDDVIRGLKEGADDYITKPFDERELLARIEAVLRRWQNGEKKLVSFKGLVWNEEAFELTYNGSEISTTPKEFALIGLFLQNPNRVFSRESLLKTIWGNKVYTEDRTIDSHVRNVRDKLRQVNFPVDDHLITVWGVGYKWIIKQE